MRVLAIRGRNLASLGEAFEVDFRAEPLASAGLYAITGPTGAGKSTLLDALCLALYGETPRLVRAQVKGASLPDVGTETLGAQDVRSLLRRGSVEGYAEVDFAGSDGIAYRARWSVRRARARTEGKLQAVEASLVRLDDGQPVAGHLKSEVLAAIQARIGLTFEQFTRAVLLAQNEFSAFLKTGDDERADLLEQLTGTDRYTDLSRRAHYRAKAEREQVGRLRADLAGQQPLEASARAALVTELQAMQARQAEATAHERLMRATVAWHEEEERLIRSAAAAHESGRAAAAAVRGATARRGFLERIARAQPARALVEELDRQAMAVQRAGAELAAAAARLQQAHASQVQAEASAAQVRVVLDAARNAHRRALPMLDQARALDGKIAVAVPVHARAVEEHRTASDAAQAQDEAHAALAARLRDAEAALARDRRWIEENAALRALATGWAGWQRRLVEAARVVAALDHARAELAGLSTQREDVQQGLDAAVGRAEAARGVLVDAQAALALAEGAAAPFDMRAIAARKAAVDARRSSLAMADGLVRGRILREQQMQGLEVRVREAAASVAAHEVALESAGHARAAARLALDQAERSARQGELAAGADVARLRTMLEADTPCPVCGATDHPYVEHDPRLDAVLTSLRREVERCRAEERAREDDERARGGELAAARARRDAAQAQLAVLSAEAASAPQWPDDLPAIAAPDQAGWLAAALLEAEADAQRLAADHEGMVAAMEARDRARRAADAAAQQEAGAAAALVATRTQHDRLTQQLDFAREQVNRSTTTLATCLDELDDAWEGHGWRAGFLADPDTFQRATTTRVEEWIARAASIDAQQREIERIGAGTAAAKQACDAAGVGAARAQEALSRAAAELGQFRSERAALLEGEPVADVEARLSAAVDVAAADLDAIARELELASAQHVRASEAQEQVRAQQVSARLAHAEAERALHAWLGTFGHGTAAVPGGATLDEVRELLGYSAAWVEGERGDLERLDRAAASAATLMAERDGELARHRARRPAADAADPEQARIALAAAESELERLRPQVAELEGRRLDDDRRIRVAGELATRIEAQEAVAEVWERLNDLIGSADGRKFRNHAQQFTLDVLLDHANHHLAALARRYRLRRIADSLGLLVIDRDMADEVRSVHSLSGGESFLVSLALALGLASLSSHRVQVESLFIDEGFGSLDPDALAIAMAALDGLQSQGRKVGVISHVQDMTERIGTRIEVQKLPGGQSRLRVVAD